MVTCEDRFKLIPLNRLTAGNQLIAVIDNRHTKCKQQLLLAKANQKFCLKIYGKRLSVAISLGHHATLISLSRTGCTHKHTHKHTRAYTRKISKLAPASRQPTHWAAYAILHNTLYNLNNKLVSLLPDGHLIANTA